MKVPVTNVEVNGVSITMMTDTGASTDIIDEPTYQLIKQGTPLTVEPDSCHAYGSKSQLEAIGKCTINIKAKSNQKDTTFHIFKGAHGSLLSYSIATRDLGLVNIDLNHTATLSNIITMESLTKEYHIAGYFQGDLMFVLFAN